MRRLQRRDPAQEHFPHFNLTLLVLAVSSSTIDKMFETYTFFENTTEILIHVQFPRK